MEFTREELELMRDALQGWHDEMAGPDKSDWQDVLALIEKLKTVVGEKVY